MALNKYLIWAMLIGFISCSATSVMSDQVTVIRDLPDSVAKGSTFTVTLSINVDEGDLPSTLGVSENVPTGWTVSSTSSNGFYFSDDSVEWLFLKSSFLTQVLESVSFVNLIEDKNITYSLKVPRDFSGDTATFSGTGFFGGVTDPAVGGDVELAIIGIYGDVNGDDSVNVFDLALMGQAWGASTGETDYNADTDLNGDGIINIFDLAILGQNWGY